MLKKIVRVISHDLDNGYFILNQGKKAGISVGQILLIEKGGVIGKIISVNKMISRALLLCSNSYTTLSVKSIRNNILFFANRK